MHCSDTMPSERPVLSLRSFARLRAARLGLPLGLVLGLSSLLVSTQASAAGITGPISGWQKGTEPSWVSMYEYVPTTLVANAPVLVLLHYCGGSASKVWGEAGGIQAAADKYGFLIVIPQTSQNCWDIATTPSLTHNGGGDTGAIVDQVKYAITKHNANPNRVYATGTSSGAMMTEGLLAVYPEVFKGGSEFAGVPAGCWAVNDPAGQWSGPCAGGTVTHTAAEWGTMVKAMYPGYTGARPRVQLWHGDADSTISFTNQTEAIKEWTNVLGLSATATSTATITIGGKQYKREQWQDSCGTVALDALTELGGPHGTDANFNATYVIPFLGLDQTGPTDPMVAKCGGGGGAGGAGSGGSSSSGGSTGSGGSQANGGATASGGSGGGSGGSGGAFPSGGSPSTGTAGSDTSGGASNGFSGASTVPVAGSGAGGVVSPTAGAPATGDDPGAGPAAATPSRPGCSCELARTRGNSGTLAWAGLLGLGLAFGRRRRARGAASAR